MDMTLRDQAGGGAVLLLRDASMPYYTPPATVPAARVVLYARDKGKGVDAAFILAEGKPGGEFSIPYAALTGRTLETATVSYSSSGTPSVPNLEHAAWEDLEVEAGTIEVTQVNTTDVIATGDGTFDGDGGFGGEVRAVGKVVAEDGLAVGNSAAATTPGTVVKKIEVFDAAGVSLGFVPVYDSIS